MNSDTRELSVKISDEEMEQRRGRWQPRDNGYERGVMAKYAKLVSSASLGAVTS